MSAKVEYGVRAMAVLALHYQEGPLPLRVIAGKEGISQKFLEQIFPALKKARLVLSVRGARGGYQLTRSPAEIRMGDIVRAVEGPINPMHCLVDHEPASRCRRGKSCPARPVWEKLRDRINDALDEVVLSELAEHGPAVESTEAGGR